MKAWTPQEIDVVVLKCREFSDPRRNLDKWKLISGLYTEDSWTIDPDGKVFHGLEGIREAWAAWAPRRRFTHGWSERVIMLTDEVALKFYRYPNCGEDDNGEPWDFMCDGFLITQKSQEGNWTVLIDVPFCRTTEWLGNREMTAPWDALLEPLQGDTRIRDVEVGAQEASYREPGKPEDCGLCQTAHARKYGNAHDHPAAAHVTCRPGYHVPVRAQRQPSPWYYEDDLCWIAECELCATPIVVSKQHNVIPSAQDREAMVARLREVVAEQYGYEPWIDPANLRIPDHFHAHARPLNRLLAHGMQRAAVPLD
jgi:ketosteroid isomerase-like protein